MKRIMDELDKMFELRNNGLCPSCGKKVHIEDFRDKLSYEEAKISGLCQSCQDKIFKTAMED